MIAVNCLPPLSVLLVTEPRTFPQWCFGDEGGAQLPTKLRCQRPASATNSESFKGQAAIGFGTGGLKEDNGVLRAPRRA